MTTINAVKSPSPVRSQSSQTSKHVGRAVAGPGTFTLAQKATVPTRVTTAQQTGGPAMQDAIVQTPSASRRQRLGGLIPSGSINFSAFRSTAATLNASNPKLVGFNRAFVKLEAAGKTLLDAWPRGRDAITFTTRKRTNHEVFEKPYSITSRSDGSLLVAGEHREKDSLLIDTTGRLFLDNEAVSAESSERTKLKVATRLNAAWDALHKPTAAPAAV